MSATGDAPVEVLVAAGRTARVILWSVIALWTAWIAGAAAIFAVHHSSLNLFGLLLVALAGLVLALVVRRAMRVAIAAAGDTLIVTNSAAVRRLQRQEIEGLRTGTVGGRPRWVRTGYLLLRDGTVLPLDAVGVGWRGDKALFAAKLERLRRWIDADDA